MFCKKEFFSNVRGFANEMFGVGDYCKKIMSNVSVGEDGKR